MYKLTLNDYIVKEDGTVINKRNQHILKPQLNGKGYLRVGIGGKLYFVHRLVAEKYLPNPNNLPQVKHKDGNKLNNHFSNLEWVDNLENRKHAIKNNLHLSGEQCSYSKLNWEKVHQIRALKGKKTQNEIAEMFGVSRGAINCILHNYTWKE